MGMYSKLKQKLEPRTPSIHYIYGNVYAYSGTKASYNLYRTRIDFARGLHDRRTIEFIDTSANLTFLFRLHKMMQMFMLQQHVV